MKYVISGPNKGKSGVWGGFHFENGACESADSPVVRSLMASYGAFPEGEPSLENSAVEPEEPTKEDLIARAVSLGIGSPSTLARWGAERLQKAISEKA